MSLSRVRGTRDLLESEAKKFMQVINVFENHTKKSGYDKIILPSLEESSLFTRSLGDSSDIVMKEMFYLQDKTYVLRPEGTAGTLRAYIMSHSLGEKKMWSYFGSMFRHERPQSGRFREFFQYGIENIGGNLSGISDAEVISIAFNIFKDLGVKCELNLNSLGDEESRIAYTDTLSKYFHNKPLSLLSKKKIEQGNFLRVLDSKENEDKTIIENAPKITEFFNKKSLDYYSEVKTALASLGVDFVENPKLVRGLDYYSNVCFEFLHEEKALAGGGRYDNLGNMLEKGKNIGGIGWAAGIDRISELVTLIPKEKTVVVVAVGSHNTLACAKIASFLRKSTEFVVKLRTDAESLKQHMNFVKKNLPDLVVFIGDDEAKNNEIRIKNSNTGKQKNVKTDELLTDPNRILFELMG